MPASRVPRRSRHPWLGPLAGLLVGVACLACGSSDERSAPPPPTPPACVDTGGAHLVTARASDEAALDRLAAEGRVAAFAVGVARSDETTWLSARGLADPSTARAVDTHTPFMLASVTKAFVAVLALILVDEGRLDLDADVRTLSPSLAQVSNPLYPGGAITPRMLLTHTSSLWDVPFTYDATYATAGDATLPMRDFVAGYFDPGSPSFGGADAWWDAEPGSFSCYSNMGFGVLGVVLEDVGGASLEELFQDRIARPLGLTHTSFRADAYCDDVLARGVRPDGVGGYVDDDLGAGPQPEGHPELASGMLKASVADLIAFSSALARQGVAADGSRLLSQEAYDALVARQLTADLPTCGDRRSDPARQALGLMHFPDGAGRDWIGHYGGMAGASSAVWFDRDSGVAYAIVQNVLDPAALNDLEIVVLEHLDQH